LTHDDFWGGIVVGSTSGSEFFVIGDAAGETEVGEGDDGVRVRGPVLGLGKFMLREIHQNIYSVLLASRFIIDD
jgi:hypothetical protein